MIDDRRQVATAYFAVSCSDWQAMPAAASLSAFSMGVGIDGWFTSNASSWKYTATPGSAFGWATTGGDNRG